MTVGAARTPLALVTELLASYAAVAVFVAAFGQGDGPAPSFAAVAAVVLGSFALARVLQMTDLDETAMRLVVLATTIAVFFVLARIEYAPDEYLWDTGWFTGLFTDKADTIRPNAHVIAGVIALAPFWLRGIMRGQTSVELDGVLTSASLGLIAVMVAALATPETREPVSWGAFALAYAACALMALALFRSPEPEASLGRFARQWALATAAIAGAVAALALIAAAIDPDAFGFLAPMGEPLRVAGRALATYVLGPILWLIYQPFRFVGWLLAGVLPEAKPVQPEDIGQEPERDPEEKRDRPWWYRLLTWAIAGGATTVVLLIAATLLWFAVRRFGRGRGRDPRERREGIEPASSLADDLGDLFGAIARRFRRAPRPRSAVQIRRLYFDMLDAASARGLERPASVTPLQFAPSLDAHFASAVPSSISNAFAASRYGEVAIDPATVSRLQQEWRAVRDPQITQIDTD